MDWNNLNDLSSIMVNAKPLSDVYGGAAQIFTNLLERHFREQKLCSGEVDIACDMIADVLHEWSIEHDWEDDESSCTSKFVFDFLTADWNFQDLPNMEMKKKIAGLVEQFITNTEFNFDEFLVYRCWVGEVFGRGNDA